MSEKVAEQPDYARSYEVEGLRDKVRRLESKVRMLIALLIDKKVIGEDFGKTLISETKPDEVIDWFLKLQKEKKENV